MNTEQGILNVEVKSQSQNRAINVRFLSLLLLLMLFMLKANSQFRIDTITITNATSGCTCNGSATATVSGGTSPYTYMWSSGGTSATIDSLCPGTDSLIVYDAKDDSASISFTIGPPPISITVNTTSTLCLKDSGTATVIVNGGKRPYTYKWSSGGTSDSLTKLSGGTYSVTITDNNGCKKDTSVTVLKSGAVLVPSFLIRNESCFGQSNGFAIIDTITGGNAPYTYLWFATHNSNDSITGLTAGIDSVMITDSSGCISISQVTITQPLPLTFIADTMPDTGSCRGSVLVKASGGTGPYSYLISAKVIFSSDTSSYVKADSLCAGTYDVCVYDANNCAICDSIHIRNASKVNGINELKVESEKLKVYPNPSSNNINIVFEKPIEAKITIENVLGEVVYSMNNTQSALFSINISDLNNGIYILKIESENNTVYKRIIKM